MKKEKEPITIQEKFVHFLGKKKEAFIKRKKIPEDSPEVEAFSPVTWLERAASACRENKIKRATHNPKLVNTNSKCSPLYIKKPKINDGFLRTGNINLNELDCDYSCSCSFQDVASFFNMKDENNITMWEHISNNSSVFQSLVSFCPRAASEIREDFLNAANQPQERKTDKNTPQIFMTINGEKRVATLLENGLISLEIKNRITNMIRDDHYKEQKKLRLKKQMHEEFPELRNFVEIGKGGANPQNTGTAAIKANGSFYSFVSSYPEGDFRKPNQASALPKIKENFYEEIVEERFKKDKSFQRLFDVLQDKIFLKDRKNMGVRNNRDYLFLDIVNKIFYISWDIRQSSPGWTEITRYQDLKKSHMVWLDDKYGKKERANYIDELTEEMVDWILKKYHTLFGNKVIYFGKPEIELIRKVIKDCKGGFL